MVDCYNEDCRETCFKKPLDKKFFCRFCLVYYCMNCENVEHSDSECFKVTEQECDLKFKKLRNEKKYK